MITGFRVDGGPLDFDGPVEDRRVPAALKEAVQLDEVVVQPLRPVVTVGIEVFDRTPSDGHGTAQRLGVTRAHELLVQRGHEVLGMRPEEQVLSARHVDGALQVSDGLTEVVAIVVPPVAPQECGAAVAGGHGKVRVAGTPAPVP
ncbi:hypothetical protein OOK36_31750 [Streptomyces sp. NBC_00365]|uniref:hypothetical protein n=1 Tax=Streptomyces sp. NBC_00365 TaxID=2975726 RepID=UPI00225A4946|nr:hypothetical protein [Streptomyces sp. NBC_00365]MCX5093383.1 hypothetical protein [Streptomyces sp. NBC_00365]